MLCAANEKGAQVVSMSTLGAGRLGYDADDIIALVISSITKFISDKPDSSIKEIYIVDNGQDSNVTKVNHHKLLTDRFQLSCQ